MEQSELLAVGASFRGLSPARPLGIGGALRRDPPGYPVAGRPPGPACLEAQGKGDHSRAALGSDPIGSPDLVGRGGGPSRVNRPIEGSLVPEGSRSSSEGTYR